MPPDCPRGHGPMAQDQDLQDEHFCWTCGTRYYGGRPPIGIDAARLRPSGHLHYPGWRRRLR